MLMESVGNLYGHCWSNVLLAVFGASYGAYDTMGSSFPVVNVGATGDTIFGIPFSQFRIRKVVARNPLLAGVSGSVATATIGLYTAAAQGGTTIAAVGSNTLSNLTANATFQELTLAAAAANTIFTGPTNYFLNVGTAVSTGTIELDIYGDIVFGKG